MCQRRFSRNICGRAFTIALYLAGALWFSGTAVSGQQLSIRHYDVSNGLAHSHVSAIHQDAKGYLWLATWEGLSRFDGYRFSNYDQRDGLGDPIINAIAEDRMGHLWVGTNGGGVARLIDDPHSPSSDSSIRRFRIGSTRSSLILGITFGARRMAGFIVRSSDKRLSLTLRPSFLNQLRWTLRSRTVTGGCGSGCRTRCSK